jgi:hypothetical protein
MRIPAFGRAAFDTIPWSADRRTEADDLERATTLSSWTSSSTALVAPASTWREMHLPHALQKAGLEFLTREWPLSRKFRVAPDRRLLAYSVCKDFLGQSSCIRWGGPVEGGMAGVR